MSRLHTYETIAAIGAGLLVVILGSAVAEPVNPEPDFRRSSYLSEPTGLKGLHEILGAVGAAPRRWRGTFDQLREPGAMSDTDQTLVIAAPPLPISSDDRNALVDWVTRGGRLVLVAGDPSMPLLPTFHEQLFRTFGYTAKPRILSSRTVGIVPNTGLDVGSELEWPVRTVLSVVEDAEADPRQGELQPLVRTRSQVLIGRIPFGDAGGEVVLCADDAPFTNRALRDADNSVLIVQLLLGREGHRGRITFDEGRQGFFEGEEPPGVAALLIPLLWTTWTGRAVLILLLAGLIALLGAAKRFGAPLPGKPPPRRRLREHADALGRLLEAAGARRNALRVLAAGVRRVVGPRTGLSPTLAPRAFRARLAKSNDPRTVDLAQALERADDGGGPGAKVNGDREFAQIARELAHARRRVIHGRS